MIMKIYPIKCVLSIVALLCIFPYTVLSAQQDDPGENESDKILYQPADKSDWVDYGDMFTYDPATMTNREPRLKTAVENIIKTRRQGRENRDGEQQIETLTSNCDLIDLKLRQCETSKNRICDCPLNDQCGKKSYVLIQRLILKLSKLIHDKSYKGSILRLTVDLDELPFELPVDMSNSTGCDYLTNINPLADHLLSSIVIFNPEPKDSQTPLKYAAFVGMTVLSVFWFFVKVPWKIRLYAIIICFSFGIYLWEWSVLYQTKNAEAEEKTNRLKTKCSRTIEPGWGDWFWSMVPTTSFAKPGSECTEYYIATRVNPLLIVNPIEPFVSLYAKSVLYAIRLTADAFGASVASFFTHIPTLFFIPILTASVILFVYLIKFSLKYRKSLSKSKTPKQKSILVKKSNKITQQESKALTEDGIRVSRRKIKKSLYRCGSTGNIQELTM